MQGSSYAKIEQLTDEIWKSLSEDESKLYDKETIKKFIFNELEHKAVFDYHFSTPQIANLRNARHGDEMKGKHKEIIDGNIEKYRDKRSELKAKYKEELQLQRSKTIDPLVQLPPLELPLELASEEDRQATIQEILSQIPQSLQLIEKNLKQIDKEVKNLKKVQGRRATEAKESITAKLLEKSELEVKKSSLEALKVAKEKGDRELLNKLLSEMARISVKSRKVDVTTLNPLYINALQDALKTEEKKLAELDEKISQIHNHREAKKLREARPPIEEKIVGLKALFERIEKIKENHESVNQVEKQYQAQLQKVDEVFIAHYERLLNSYVSIEALQSFAKNPYLADLYPIMWEKALKKLLDATPAATGPAPKFDQALKKSLQPYIQAKAKLLSLSMAEDAKIIEMLDRIESRIQTEEVKNYIQEAAQTYQEPTVEEMLFDEEVLNHITTPESSPFRADQQADLMRLTKLFNRATKVEVKRGKHQPPVPLTGSEKQELKEALNRLEKDDSIFEALKRFSSNDDREDVEQFLSFIPPFIRWIAKKFVVDDAKKVEKFIPGGITSQSIEFLTTYLSKTKKIAKEEAAIKQLHSKAETLIAKYRENPESITPAERLSLKELGIISRVARLNESDDEDKKSFLAQLDALGLIEVDPKLQDLKELAQKSQALLKEIDDLIRPSINAHYKDGDLLAYVGNKKSTWMGTPISFEERMTMFAANGFTHGAKLYRKNDEVQISHIYGNLEQDKISLYQLCISDVWELDVVPLVPASMQDVLKEVYGENWKTTVNELYQSIEQELHTKGATQFANVGNNQERRLAAGFADHPLLFKLLGKEGIKGHEKEFERDFNQIHGKFFEGAPLHDDQICSEFASKATLVSMIELNKRLTRDIQAKLGNDYFPKEVLAKLNANGTALPSEVKDYLQGIRHFKKDREITKKAEKDLKQLLKNNGYTPQEINLIIRLGNEEVLDLPYSKKERLKAIHPGRMVSLLVDKKCARLRPPPKAVEALIAMK
ncbi:Conserved hypothetical protein [Candidatus Protochlamydia naegleriophila]|uniref:Uncharacterized protein n=1 Tax=Candidatus Protochlamydia naegleriophila TaxID=389348 RepID=A0A0U5JFP4_9BACT|nr:hypothetical protein [Candidatus Protochlamydia naegleriophila]CUI16566.1 Conserved hypothetical protein [Candidatus Protochlamydia naegleriophila]